MEKEVSVEIISLCRSIDVKAVEIYRSLSEGTDDKDQKAFWWKMSEEEEEHVDYWNKLLTMTEEGLLPQVFENPIRVREELKNAAEKTDSLLRKSQLNPSLTNAFLLALRLEFYVLHPAFETLFHFLQRE